MEIFIHIIRLKNISKPKGKNEINPNLISVEIRYSSSYFDEGSEALPPLQPQIIDIFAEFILFTLPGPFSLRFFTLPYLAPFSFAHRFVFSSCVIFIHLQIIFRIKSLSVNTFVLRRFFFFYIFLLFYET